MTHECFQVNIKRLLKSYGEKSIPDARLRMIGTQFKSLTDSQFADVCDQIIANHNNSPTLKIFWQYAEDYILANREVQEAEFRRRIQERRSLGQNCKSCDDSGLVSAIHITNRYTFSFGCPETECKARDFFHPSARVWTPADALEYMVLLSNDRRILQDLFEETYGTGPKKVIGEDFVAVVEKFREGSIEL